MSGWHSSSYGCQAGTVVVVDARLAPTTVVVINVRLAPKIFKPENNLVVVFQDKIVGARDDDSVGLID